MKIVSKFKDYYDVSMGYGTDESLVFNRSQVVLPLPTTLFTLVGESEFGEHGWGAEPPYCSVNGMILGFCGRVFPIVEITRDNHKSAIADVRKLDFEMNDGAHEPNSDRKKVDTKTARTAHVFYDANTFFKSFKPILDTYKNLEHISRFDQLNISLDMSPKDIEPFFSPNISDHALLEVFNELGAPIFLASYHGVLTNPCLKEFGFVSRFDPFSTFQEISMFLSGVLTEREEIQEPSDKVKLGKKGFDNWSFKKRPESKN